ncbi:prenyltransferase [Paenibacillus sp. PAMC21692]|uniref:prenyltransferase n=1 Tax=Paenibacillus sp. PAMC21692 TaxID=2762320 RepID=UPI00164E045B|nr:prenyltransferase [Paenibacillus sp. PAMC21692]QNK58694.1 prenyltransferase [Paenibacillus sp. PAMC21692]
MSAELKRLWSGFWQLADPKIWIASTVPMLVGGALAYAHTGTVHLWWFGLALIGIYLIEIGKNAVNEFVDYLTGVDQYVTPDKRNPFSGGKKTIVDGKLSIIETAIIAFLTLAAAFWIGVSIAVFREPTVFWIGMAGGILAVFYSLPPFKLNYNGLGEIAVGLTFGPLIVGGMYVMLTGSLDWQVMLAGVPLAFLITNVLWINQYPDYEADMKGEKRNWLVRIGKKAGIKLYSILYASAYASLIVLVIVQRNPYWLLGFASLPLAIGSVRTAAANLNNLSKFIKANAATVMIYQIVGVTMIVAALMV